MLAWLRSLANTILGKTGKSDRLDTATRMAMDADFRERGERLASDREPVPMVDPIDELMRIVGEQETDGPPRSPKTLFPDCRRPPKGRGYR